MMVYIHPLKLVSGAYLSSLSNAFREVSWSRSFASSWSEVNLYAKRYKSSCTPINSFWNVILLFIIISPFQ